MTAVICVTVVEITAQTQGYSSKPLSVKELQHCICKCLMLRFYHAKSLVKNFLHGLVKMELLNYPVIWPIEILFFFFYIIRFVISTQLKSESDRVPYCTRPICEGAFIAQQNMQILESHVLSSGQRQQG